MVELTYTATPLDQIDHIHAELKKTFLSGKARSIAFRKKQVLQLAYLVQENTARFQESLASDLGRHKLESNLVEISGTITEAMHSYKGIDKWTKTESAPFNLNFAAMRPVVRKEPKGVVLIIAPFNYPIWLLLGPMAGAIAAGNAVVIKPSELAPATSALVAELLPKYLDQSLYRCVLGAVDETTKLLELQWDHILYTGSGRVARIVAAAAAKNLTPFSLELGGKSPVVVDPNCDMQTAARRILWGKTVNAGQTCVAPDYVLVPKVGQDALVEALKEAYTSFYPDGPAKSDSFSRIVSPGHFDRVKGMLEATKGTVVLGGAEDADKETKFIAPTVVKDVLPDDSLMSGEIFGPVLPIVAVENVDKAIEYINSNDHPLALYVFSQDPAFKSKVFDNTQSGSAIANETLLHCTAEGLPFGGIGPSGYGAHTGRYSFDMFTHLRSSLDSPKWVDKILGFRYPPYTDKKMKMLNTLIFPKLPARS